MIEVCDLADLPPGGVAVVPIEGLRDPVRVYRVEVRGGRGWVDPVPAVLGGAR